MTGSPRHHAADDTMAATGGRHPPYAAAMVSIPLSTRPDHGVPRPATTLLGVGRRRVRSAYTGLVTARPSDPFEPLRRHLAALAGEDLTLTFTDIEQLLGTSLPEDAWRRTWWANAPDVPQARAWLRAGWQVRWVRRRGSEAAVTFTRARHPRPRRP